MTDAYQHDPSGKTAESDDQPVSGGMPETGQQSLFAELADGSLQRGGGEGPGAGLATERQDYLEKLKREHLDYLAGLEATGHEPLDETEESAQPSGGKRPDEVPQETFSVALDAVPQENLIQTAEESLPPIVGETPSASEGNLSSVTLRAEQLDYLAKLEADHQARLAKLEAERQKPVDETAEESMQPVAVAMPVAAPEEAIAAAQDTPPQEQPSDIAEESPQPVAAEIQEALPQHSFAAAQDAPPQEHPSEIAEENPQPVAAEIPEAFPQYSFDAAQDTPPQEHPSEIAEENPQPVAAETPEAFPQYSFDAAQDAAPHEHFGKPTEEYTPPVAEMQAAGQQEHADTALGAEQLDYLSKLDAQHQEYLARLEAAKRPSVDAVAEQPEPAVPLHLPAANLPALEPPAFGEPIAPIELLPPIKPIPPAEQPGPASNAAVTIVVIGIILGVLFGGLIAAITWKVSKPTAPPAPVAAAPEPNLPRDTRDLGSVDSSAVGLSGHLTTKWDGKLAYTFVIAPDDAARQAQFALMVGDPPRPLSMNIELKNSYGFILCSREAVLKYDAAKAAADWKLQGDTSAPSPVDEAAREKDKDVFQNQTGADGKLASISAQGEIPCPAEAYANFAYWSFTPNYPDITEQDQLLQEKLDAAAPAPSKRIGRRRSRTARTH